MKPFNSAAPRLIVLLFCVGLLPSCKLIGSIVKIPVDVVKSVGKTAGITNLTDEAPQPVKRNTTPSRADDKGMPPTE